MKIYLVSIIHIDRYDDWHPEEFVVEAVAFKYKKDAEKYIENIKKFVPKDNFTEQQYLACVYELWKMGYMSKASWCNEFRLFDFNLRFKIEEIKYYENLL